MFPPPYAGAHPARAMAERIKWKGFPVPPFWWTAYMLLCGKIICYTGSNIQADVNKQNYHNKYNYNIVQQIIIILYQTFIIYLQTIHFYIQNAVFIKPKHLYLCLGELIIWKRIVNYFNIKHYHLSGVVNKIPFWNFVFSISCLFK